MGTVTQGNVTFTWTGNETSGNFVDGPAYVVKSTGSISVNEPSPAETTNLGGVVHGAQLNPIYVAPGKQGYCAHSQDYDAAYKQSSWPVAMSAGDNLVKAISRTDTPGSIGEVTSWDNGQRRRGVNVEYGTLCVVASTPDAETFAPPVCVGNAGALPFKQTRYADLDAAVAAAPSYDVSSFSANVPTFAEVMSGIDYWAPLYAQLNGASTGSGYQAALPLQWANGGSNYGRDSIRWTDAAALLFISNSITASEKKQILIRMISLGAQWHEGLKAGGFVNGGNGAHHQFGFMPMMFYLYYTQGNFNDMLQYTPNHQLAQTFYIDQSALDNELTLFHTNTAWAQSTKSHTVTAVNGNTITFAADVGGSLANHRYLGARILRESGTPGQSDGTSTLITSVPGGGQATVSAQPRPPFAVNDKICFEFDHPNGYAVGQGHWGIGTSQGVKTWGSFIIGQDASYRNLQFWAGGLIVCEAMGWTGFNGYDGFKAYVEACNGYNGNNATNIPWNNHHQDVAGKSFSQNFWDTHYAAIDGGSGPALPTLPVGSVTASVTVQ